MTNRRAARALRAWTARASTPLPVPLSPRSSTVASVGATWNATSNEDPTIIAPDDFALDPNKHLVSVNGAGPASVDHDEALHLAREVGDALCAAAENQGTSLAKCVDRLTVRLGERAVRRPVAHASHIPERAQRWQPPLAPEPASQGALAFPQRPLKLLDRPEAIAVLYTSPDGFPQRFRWRGQVHDIARVEGPERIAPEWWREKSTVRLRDYYRIEDGEGRRYWIYRHGLAGDGRGGPPEWFLQGLCA